MKLYAKFLAIHIKSQMQYKASLFFTILGQFLTSFASLLGVWFMFSRFYAVEGFTLSQVLLCYATVLLSFSLAECFGRGFDLFPAMIGNGEFDRALVRPRSPVFQVLAAKIDLARMGKVLQAILVFCYGIPTSGVVWTGAKIATLVLMILGGFAVFFCLFVIYAAVCFFTIEGLEFMNILTYGGQEFGRYPFVIYGKNVLWFLTFIVPLALFQYYPLLYLLGRENSLFHRFAPLLGLLFALPAYGFWRFGLHRYKSTGS